MPDCSQFQLDLRSAIFLLLSPHQYCHVTDVTRCDTSNWASACSAYCTNQKEGNPKRSDWISEQLHKSPIA